MWESERRLFIFGYQFPGSIPQNMRLAPPGDGTVVDDPAAVFTPLESLSPQLPTNWTPEQCIRASNRIARGEQ
jgi:hypothetical protein